MCQAAFAPAKYHAVDEGALPAARPGARCPSGMANVGARFCVDRYEGSLVEKIDGELVPWAPYDAPIAGHAYVARSVASTAPSSFAR